MSQSHSSYAATIPALDSAPLAGYNVRVPAAPHVPGDIALLDSADPMSLTLIAIGGPQYLDRAHRLAIAGLIQDTLNNEAERVANIANLISDALSS